MRIVCGLGNPGERYRRTRHNAGFLVVDVLAARAGASPRLDRDAWLGEARLADEQVLLVKPLCFMNLSGLPLARILAETGGSAADLVVIVDDVALDLGVVRVRERGGHGGHNGLRSVAAELGSEEFARVRIGVRRGELPADLAEYVLSAPPPEEEKDFQDAVTLAAEAVECVVREGSTVAMDRFNGRRG